MSHPPSGSPDDVQRPLEESVPVADEPEAGGPAPAAPPGAGIGPLMLRRAVPAPRPSDPEGGAGAPAGATHPEAGPAGGAAAPVVDVLDSAERPGSGKHRAGGPWWVRTGRAVVRAPAAVLGAGPRALQATAAWARRPGGRLVLPGVLIVALVATALVGGAFVGPTVGDPEEGPPGPGGVPGVPGSPGAVPGTAAPAIPGIPGQGGHPAEALTEWAEQAADRTGIPMIAVRAYGYAEVVAASTQPSCRLSWTTLAGIGRVESNHGSSGGATLLPDGRALPAIVGDQLDGEGDRLLIQDTDRGELDGDPLYDRAVGPMQFIPQTWRTVLAPHRGIADVHNINDAALAAADYLCRAGRDLSTAPDWRAAILSYNNVQTYAEEVFAAANDYGIRSRGG